jgi:hypothetical protein
MPFIGGKEKDYVTYREGSGGGEYVFVFVSEKKFQSTNYIEKKFPDYMQK